MEYLSQPKYGKEEEDTVRVTAWENFSGLAEVMQRGVFGTCKAGKADEEIKELIKMNSLKEPCMMQGKKTAMCQKDKYGPS